MVKYKTAGCTDTVDSTFKCEGLIFGLSARSKKWQNLVHCIKNPNKLCKFLESCCSPEVTITHCVCVF